MARTEVTLHGVDGSEWDLRRGPVRIANKGVEGFGAPKFIRNTTTSPARDGQQRSNLRSRAQAREGFLPVWLLGSRVEGGLPALLTAWFNAWAVDVPARLKVDTGATTRSLSVYFVEDDLSPELDPNASGDLLVGITWGADQPYWESGLVANPDLYPTLFNAGDVSAMPLLTITPTAGTVTGFSFESGNISGSLPLSAYTGGGWDDDYSSDDESYIHLAADHLSVGVGERLVLSNERGTALLYDGSGPPTNVADRLTHWRYGEIPPRFTAGPGTWSVDGGEADVRLSFNPRFLRAF